MLAASMPMRNSAAAAGSRTARSTRTPRPTVSVQLLCLSLSFAAFPRCWLLCTLPCFLCLTKRIAIAAAYNQQRSVRTLIFAASPCLITAFPCLTAASFSAFRCGATVRILLSLPFAAFPPVPIVLPLPCADERCCNRRAPPGMRSVRARSAAARKNAGKILPFPCVPTVFLLRSTALRLRSHCISFSKALRLSLAFPLPVFSQTAPFPCAGGGGVDAVTYEAIEMGFDPQHFTAFPLPFSLPFRAFPLPLHCLSVTFHCPSHCLSVIFHCPCTAFP